MFERIALIERSLHSAMSAILLVLSFLSSIMSLIRLCWERARFGAIVITRGTAEETSPRIFLKHLKKTPLEAGLIGVSKYSALNHIWLDWLNDPGQEQPFLKPIITF